MMARYPIGPTRMPIGTFPQRMPPAPMPLPVPQLPVYQQPVFQQPVFQQPFQQPIYQQPYQRPGVYPTVPVSNPVADVFHGMGERLQEIGQYVLHPLNAAARRMPYHNPYQPRSGAEEAGRWIVNGGLIVGGLLLGRGLLGGGFVGGAARVGSNNGIAFGLGSAIRSVGMVLTAPFRAIGAAFSAGLR